MTATATPNLRCALALALIIVIVALTLTDAVLPPGMPAGALVVGDKGGKTIVGKTLMVK